jgi:PAS domain S-box-containing protein
VKRAPPSLPRESIVRKASPTSGDAGNGSEITREATDESRGSFQRSFETIIDPLVLLRPVRGQADEIVDFVYEDANAAACEDNGLTRQALVGMRVLGPLTHVPPAGLFDAYANVYEGGEPLALNDFAYTDSWGGQTSQRFFHLRAGRAGEVIVLTWRDVTARHIAANEQSQLAAIVRSSPDAIVSTDHDLRVTSWNRGAEVMYGYRADDVLGTSTDFLIPPDDALERRQLREPTLVVGGVRHYETQRLHKDGRLVDVSITAFPLIDVAGRTYGAVSVTRDITRHNDDVRELAESEARYRDILEMTPDGVWRVDAEGHTDYVNSRMASMLGYSRDEMLGHEVSEFMSPESRSVAMDEITRARRDGQPAVAEHCWARRDGTPCWTRVSQTAITDKHGAYAGSLSIMSDISATKAQAIELRQTEHFLAALTDSMADGMFALNPVGRVSFMNQAAVRLLGWSQAELATRSMHDTTHYQNADGSPCLAADCRVLRALHTGTTIRVDDDVFTRRDGRVLPVTYSAAPVSIDGQVNGIVVVFRDVTVLRAEKDRRKRELETLSWVGRIRDALDQERLVLHAQPIVDLHSRKVVRHELLLRMVDSDGTVIPPGRFLPAAEQFGLIEEIDRWVLAQAVTLAASGLTVHFNISGSSLGSALLIGDLVRLLRDTDVDPARLVCEITETALASDEESAEAFVYELTRLGCEVVLDDFGMGYGGFAYLKRLPVTILKIDIEFVRDLVDSLQNQQVVKAIVNLARGFGRKTVAEGVETEATVELLEEYGVDYAQGYFLGRPGPLDAVSLDTPHEST